MRQPNTPKHLDLKKDQGLTIEWADGSTSYYPIPYLRRMSPSADMRQLRDDMEKNPLTVLPSSHAGGSGGTGGSGGSTGGGLTVADAELVGNYAIRLRFSDGHSTGIYSWDYLRSIDPDVDRNAPGPPQGDGDNPSTAPPA